MSKAVIFFAQGLEECEGLLCVDLLRRAGVEVTVAAVGGQRAIVSSHKVRIESDALAEELDYAAFEKALYSYDHDTEDYGYWNFIDEDNFVDYYLINEFSLNIDAGRYSTYLYKDIGGRSAGQPYHVHGGDARPWEPGAGVFRLLLYPAVYGGSQRLFRGLCRVPLGQHDRM